MADQVATSYTFNGTTVVFSATDQALLDADFKKISEEAAKLEGFLNERANWQGEYNYNQDRLYKISGNCVGLSGKGNPSPWKVCSSDAENRRNFASSRIGTLDSQIKTSMNYLNKDIPNSYVSIYNNHLLQIQNKIKLQIQAQQANQATADANTQNQTTLNQNTPAAIAQANALSAQLQQQVIEAEKQKALKNKQYLFFGILALAVLITGVVIIRNVKS